MAEQIKSAAAAAVDESDGIGEALESVERVEASVEFVSSGFGAVSGRLGKEKQAQLDRSLDALESLGEGYAREEAIAHQQFHEVAAEVETAGKLFWEGLTDPEGLWNRMKEKGA